MKLKDTVSCKDCEKPAPRNSITVPDGLWSSTRVHIRTCARHRFWANFCELFLLPYTIQHWSTSLTSFLTTLPWLHTIQSHTGPLDIPWKCMHAPTPGPLYLLLPLLTTLLPRYLHGLFFTSLSFCSLSTSQEIFLNHCNSHNAIRPHHPPSLLSVLPYFVLLPSSYYPICYILICILFLVCLSRWYVSSLTAEVFLILFIVESSVTYICAWHLRGAQ